MQNKVTSCPCAHDNIDASIYANYLDPDNWNLHASIEDLCRLYFPCVEI
jgi:hypothetical protein